MSRSDMKRISESKSQIISLYNSIIKTFDIVSSSTCGIHNARTSNVYDKIAVMEHLFGYIHVYPGRNSPECLNAITEIIRLIKILFAIYRPDYPHVFNDLDILAILKNHTIRGILDGAKILDYQERALKYETMETQIDELSKSVNDLNNGIASCKIVEIQLSKTVNDLKNENAELIISNKLLTDKINEGAKFTVSISTGTNLIVENNGILTNITTSVEKFINLIDNTKVRINNYEYSIINPLMPNNLTESQTNTVKIIKGEPIKINGMFQSIAPDDLDLKLLSGTTVILSAGTKLCDTNGINTILCQNTFAII